MYLLLACGTLKEGEREGKRKRKGEGKREGKREGKGEGERAGEGSLVRLQYVMMIKIPGPRPLYYQWCKPWNAEPGKLTFKKWQY